MSRISNRIQRANLFVAMTVSLTLGAFCGVAISEDVDMLKIPRVTKPWTEALRLAGDSRTLYSDFALIKDKLGRWHCIGTFGKGSDDDSSGYAVSDGHSLFHVAGDSLDSPMELLPKIGYQNAGTQAFMWAPGIIWNQDMTTAFLYYFHYHGNEEGRLLFPEKDCCRLLVSTSWDLSVWRPYCGPELVETNMVFKEQDDRDFCVFWDDRLDKYLMYYACAGMYPGISGSTTVIRVRTSDNLLNWSEPVTVMGPPPEENYCGGAESPFVLHRDGYYYLWVSGLDYSSVWLYISEDPLNFGNPRNNLIEKQPGHAAEIVSEGGLDYMACSMVSSVPSSTPAEHDLDGIRIQQLHWFDASLGMKERVTRKSMPNEENEN